MSGSSGHPEHVTGGRDEAAPVVRAVVVSSASVVAGGVVWWAWRRFGPASRPFAFVVVWVPMTWLGTISRVVTPRLPERYHRLRAVEADGRVYELAGVRVVKALLRRGPIAVFNPSLHLPSEPTPERIAHLDQRMRDAEASHAILFGASLGLAAAVRAKGWRSSSRWILGWNLLMNGYPVMLQRYNRALLAQRFATR